MADLMYYFYRCRRCNGLITRLQLRSALRVGAVVCPCGSGTISPTNPVGLEWLKPAVLKMSVLQMFGRLEAAPEPSLPSPIVAGIRNVAPLSAEELTLGDDE